MNPRQSVKLVLTEGVEVSVAKKYFRKRSNIKFSTVHELLFTAKSAKNAKIKRFS